MQPEEKGLGYSRSYPIGAVKLQSRHVHFTHIHVYIIKRQEEKKPRKRLSLECERASDKIYLLRYQRAKANNFKKRVENRDQVHT